MYVPSNDTKRTAPAPGLHARAVEQVTQQHALPLDVMDPPARHALKVLRELRGRERDELLIGQGERIVDEAVDAQAVVGLALARHVSRDVVDPEAADRQERRESRAVLRERRPDGVLEPVLRLGAEQHAQCTQAGDPEDHPPSDWLPVHAGQAYDRLVALPTRPSGRQAGGCQDASETTSAKPAAMQLMNVSLSGTAIASTFTPMQQVPQFERSVMLTALPESGPNAYIRSSCAPAV